MELSTTFRREIPAGQYSMKKAESTVSYSAGSTDAETIANGIGALNSAAQQVLSFLGISYEVRNGLVVELPEETATNVIQANFPGSQEVTPKYQPAQNNAGYAPKPAAAPSDASAWLANYTGNNTFLLDVKSKTVALGKPLSEKQDAAVAKRMREELVNA